MTREEIIAKVLALGAEMERLEEAGKVARDFGASDTEDCLSAARCAVREEFRTLNAAAKLLNEAEKKARERKADTPPAEEEVSEEMRLDQLTKAQFQHVALGILNLTGLELYQRDRSWFALDLDGEMSCMMPGLTTVREVWEKAKALGN